MEDPVPSLRSYNGSIPRLPGIAGAPATGISDVNASSQSAEERLVRELYQKRDPDGPDGKSLDSALEIISVQLNSTPSHFLLELLQNADDAKYGEGVVPEFKASATIDKNLVLQCNEIGFTNDDVEGICDIGRSTKRESATTTGEKGIGFKCVFRLADLVWIASKGFTFKLDKNEKLGLIRPLWDSNFPIERAQWGTTMFLRIPSRRAGGEFGTKSPWDEVLNTMNSFDVTYMLFLRQLRKVELVIYGISWVYARRDSTADMRVQSETIAFRRSVITRDGDPYRSYIVLKKGISGLSQRSSQRPMTTSEIELAFPVKHDFAEAESRHQHLYTFLPVKSTRFKFLIQADFVLAASREDVEQSSKWNCELRDAIPDVFVAAVDRFNSSSLRYSWLLYLSSADEMDTFFRPMMQDLLAKLKASPILETENGGEDMAPPEQLVSVPEKYRYTPGEDCVTRERSRTDSSKCARAVSNTSRKRTANHSSGPGRQAPLIPSSGGKGTYLSLNYPAECKPSLELLGVREMDYYRFVDDFSLYVNNHHAAFAAQPAWWHERISKVLMEGYIWDSGCQDKLKSLRIVPLVHPTVCWDTTGVEGTLFFSGDDSTSSSLPRGAGLRRIDPVVQKGTRRFDLLERLGAKVASREKESIHALLEHWHSAKTPPTSTTEDDLVSHAVFLFRSNYRRPIYSSSQPVDFWVATTTPGMPRPGSETHFEAYPELDDQQATSVLYDGYLKAVEKHEREPLRKWMEEQVGLWSCPRLVSTQADCELSREMSSIRDKEPYRFLGILKKYWGAYRRRFESDSVLNRVSLSRLRTHITDTEVVCQNGERVPLNKTILSEVNLGELIGITPLPILSLPVDDSKAWQFLQSFGVQLGLAVGDWVVCLEKLSGRLDTEVSHVAEAYKWLQKLGNGGVVDLEKVNDAFRWKKLVFIPSESHPKGEPGWVSAKDCVWQGHQSIKLRQYFCLVEAYDKFKLRDLFVEIIGVEPTVGIGHLVDEAKHIKYLLDTTENLEYISRLCEELSFRLQHDYFIGRNLATGNDQAYQNYLEQLHGIELFPIQPAGPRGFTHFVDTRSAGASESWYVADRDHFRHCFQGCLDILRLDIKQIEKCDALLRKLKCRDRFLSKVAELNTDEMAQDGGLERQEDVAARLRKKARYIDSLSSKPTGVGAMSRMREIQVHSADAIRVTWKVGGVSSHIDSRRAIATISGNVLSIFLQKADLDRRPQRPPLELAEEMAFLFMVPRDRTHLVQFVLACEETGDIEATLRKAGVSILSEGKHSEDATPVVNPVDSENPNPEAGVNDGQAEGESDERVNEKSQHEIAPNAEREPTQTGAADAPPEPEGTVPEQEPLPDRVDKLKKADQREKEEPQGGISKTPPSNPPTPPLVITESPAPDKMAQSAVTDTVGELDEGVCPPKKSSAVDAQAIPSVVAPSEEEFEGLDGVPQAVPSVVARSQRGSGGLDGNLREDESLDQSLPGHISNPETPAAIPSGASQSDSASRAKDQGADQGSYGKNAKADLETAPPKPALMDPLTKPRRRPTIPLQKQRDAALAKFLLDLSPPTDVEEKANIDETPSQTPGTSAPGRDYKSGGGDSRRIKTDRSPSDTERTEMEQTLGKYLSQNSTEEVSDTSRNEAFPGASQDPRPQRGDSINDKQRPSPMVFPPLQAMEKIKEGITGTSESAKLKNAMAEAERERLFKRRLEVENQFGQIVQGSQLLTSTGPTNVYYVSNRQYLPPLDPSRWSRNTLAVLESRMQVLDDASKNRAVYALLPSPSSRDDVEDDFLGQVWISQWLWNHLGPAAYDPNMHWRSGYRTKLGYTRPNPLPKDDETPFQVTDEAGVLAKFLAGMGYRAAGQWARHGHAVTYHIDVKATRSEAPIPTFSILYSRFDKAREYRIEAGDKQPDNVFIFVIISNIHSITEPRAAFYVNPWAAFADGRAKVAVTQDTLTLSFHQDIDAKVPGPAYQPPPEMKRPWFSRLATKMINRVLSSRRQLPEPGVDADYYPDSGRPGLVEYRWKPLDRPDKMIRLLKLYGGSGELYGSLVSFSLDARDRPAYTALSYTWGSGLKMFTLRILRDGERRSGGPHRTIPITASLYLALRKIRPRREHHPPLYIWADAVCIAQTPTRDAGERYRSWERRLHKQIREKTQQIRLLAGIFTSAEMVWAWLGDQEPGDGSQAAMSLLDKLGSQLEDFRKAGRSLRTLDAAALFRNFDLPNKVESVWAAVGDLISRRWFSRVWIVQEVVLATRISIRCGNSTTSWDRFFWAVRLCLLVAEFSGFSIADGQARKNVLELGERRNRCWVDGKLEIKGDMFELLEAFHQKGATVPRDRLFALLSMAADETKAGLEPDYRLSLLDLVKRWGSAFVDLGRGIDLLYLARLSWKNEYDDSEHRGYRLPSWLPDLTASQFPETISKWTDLFKAGIAPDGHENAIVDASATVERDELCIQGYVVDTIKELGERDLGSNSSDPRRYLRAIFKMIDTKAKEAKLSEDEIRDIRCKLPIGGADVPTRRYWDSKNPKVTALDAYRYLDRYLQLRESGEPWEDEEYRLRAAADGDAMHPSLEEIADPLMAYIDTASKFADKFYPAHAVVCWTKGNRAALVPHVAQKDDVVVIVPGAKVPLILRQETAVAHVLVGEGYVHGIMCGEALTMQGDGRMEPTRIRLM